ncbi:MAG TPA: ABC transporter permease [Saprospiraceae bacterium]|nr:ABC transporter permease [Saprospiraceae bacterium]HRX29798.1 ABC transporter permease [Saprospiraceae bacterium]
MEILESIKIAIESIRSNVLRSLLTIAIISIGIAALVGMLAAIDGILYSLSDNFNKMGANSFSITANDGLQNHRRGVAQKREENINFDQASSFKEKYNPSGAKVSISTWCSSKATITYGDKKTNPTTYVDGVDENYLLTSSFEIDQGRSFSHAEVYSSSPKIILGYNIVDKLFDGKAERAVGKYVSLDGRKYLVVGTLMKKGSGSGDSNDKRVLIPLINAKVIYGYSDKVYRINVVTNDVKMISQDIDQAIGTMRVVRKLKAFQENNFEIKKSDGILEKMKDMTSTLRLSTIVIAMLTLLGASIGLMNIMLVTVTERTREIGVRKALGATSNNILIQFLTEAVVICLIGGVIGIILGIALGLVVTLSMNGHFVIPWLWILLGITVCILVGIISGLYPSLKAAKLDPIASLRYE